MSLSTIGTATLSSAKKFPIADLAQWLEKSLPLITPKSQLDRAMIYLHKQWGKLTVFLQSGDVPIHNNQAENKIRPFVIGCRIQRRDLQFNRNSQGQRSGPGHVPEMVVQYFAECRYNKQQSASRLAAFRR